MNKELKKKLFAAYAAPLPRRKKDFLINLNYPQTRWPDFISCQIGFIKKRVWIFSILLLTAAIIFEIHMQKGDIRLLWVISALTPFFVLISITEIARSTVFGMAELEMTAKYNLKNLLIVRMGILGAGDLLLLIAVIPLLSFKLNIGLLRIGVYLLLPYFLTCLLSFILINYIRNSDIPFYCAGAAAVVSVFGFLFNSIQSVIYREQYFVFWVAVLTLLIIALCKALRKFMNNMEELKCSLSLTA